MFRKYIILFFVFSACITGIKADDNFAFNFDYSVFREESSKVFVEFYYAFDPHQLLFVKSNSGYEASGRIEILITRKSDSRVFANKDFKIPLSLNDTGGFGKDVKLTGQINMILDSGIYLLYLKASDFSDSLKYSVSEETMTLLPYPENTAALSSIQLSTDIIRSDDTKNIFYKNTLEVTPNPSALFGNNIPKLFYYTEIYNLNKKELGDKYFIEVALENNNIEVKNSKKTYNVITGSKVEFGSFDISDLPSRKYTLIMKLLDSKGTEVTRNVKQFYVYNSNVSVLNTDLTEFENEYLLSEYPSLKEEQIEDEFDKVIYLMSDMQKNQYKTLVSLDARKMYMFKFWKGISNILPKKEYMSRIESANKQFKSDFKEGWKTDRGRVYAIYGKYDEIERFPYEGSTRAYEIWTYNILQGGAIFVFIDMSAGYGDYTLIHSTAQNEVRDIEWQYRLRVR